MIRYECDKCGARMVANDPKRYIVRLEVYAAAGPVELDTSRQELTVNSIAIELTSYEYRIIEHLMIRAGEVISKTELTDRLYDQDFERDSNVIEVFIGRLRKKMDPDNHIKPIETLRGRGYRFALERNQSD